jgi:hypothetical protein
MKSTNGTYEIHNATVNRPNHNLAELSVRHLLYDRCKFSFLFNTITRQTINETVWFVTLNDITHTRTLHILTLTHMFDAQERAIQALSEVFAHARHVSLYTDIIVYYLEQAACKTTVQVIQRRLP